MFFEMRCDLGTLDSGERSLPFGLLVKSVVHIMYCNRPVCRGLNGAPSCADYFKIMQFFTRN